MVSFKLNEYQQLALRTANKHDELDKTLMYLALGLNGEAGEVAEIVKKAFFHGHPLKLIDLEAELGDTLWYIAVMADAMGLTLADVAQTNISKLRRRYPNGFESERSIDRTGENQ
jgi:NTP pyrophosphatase (non-canonical NTP hydrolase)